MYFLGMTGHFGLGNSNSLATIDVAGAFIVNFFTLQFIYERLVHPDVTTYFILFLLFAVFSFSIGHFKSFHCSFWHTDVHDHLRSTFVSIPEHANLYFCKGYE